MRTNPSTEGEVLRSAGLLVRLRAMAPQLVVVALFLLGLYALHRLLGEVRLRDVVNQMAAIPAQTLALAALTTTAGYAALVGYDWSALKYVGKKLPLPVVTFTSFVGFALSNSLGVGALSGAAVRYRLYSKLGLDGGEVAIVSAFCAFGFGFGITVVGSAALILHPGALADFFSWPPTAVRGVGVVILVGTLGLLIYRSRIEGTIRLWRWSIRLPGPGILAAQLGFSALDIGFAGATLFLLLPQSDLPFMTFMALFALAALAGVISHVPGGIGVFEGVMLTALQFYMPADGIAAALFAYRAIYYLGPFALAMLLLAASEFVLAAASRVRALQSLASATMPVLGVVRQSSPTAAAGISFISGILLIVGSSIPASQTTLDALEALFPLAFVELSHLVGSVFGVLLIVLAPALRRRVASALWVIVGMLIAGALLSLTQNLDFDRFAVMALAAIALMACRKAFYRRSRLLGEPVTPAWFLISAAALIALIWLLLFSYKTVPYSNELWWQFAFDHQAPRGLRAAVAAVSTFLILFVAFALRPPKPRLQRPDAATLAGADAIIRGQDNADANLALVGDKMLMFSSSDQSFVMYGTHGRSWVTLGDPVGRADDGPDLVWSFKDLADTNNGRPAFYQVGEEYLTWYIDAGMSLYKLGEEARVSLADFGLEGPERRDLRQSHNRAERDGLTFELVAPPASDALLQELATISNAWLATKNAQEKGFSLGRFSIDYVRQFPLALVREHGRLTAFANVFVTDTRAEATIDLMRHLPEASRVTMDFLFIELMLALKTQDFKEFNLGMAPLAGLADHPQARAWDRLGTYLYRHAGHFYNFDGLRRFKAKFDPTWKPKYLAAPGGLDPLIVSVDIAALIGGGLSGVVKR